MVAKLQIKHELQLSLSKLENLIASIGLQSKDSYTEEEYQQIIEAHTRPQETKKPETQELQKMDLSAQGGVSFIEKAVQSAAKEGTEIAKKRVVARFSAMVQTENQLMQQGFQLLGDLDEKINAYEIDWAHSEGEVSAENFFEHLFPECTPKILPSSK